jgi:hypothetical protein
MCNKVATASAADVETTQRARVQRQRHFWLGKARRFRRCRLRKGAAAIDSSAPPVSSSPPCARAHHSAVALPAAAVSRTPVNSSPAVPPSSGSVSVHSVSVLPPPLWLPSASSISGAAPFIAANSPAPFKLPSRRDATVSATRRRSRDPPRYHEVPSSEMEAAKTHHDSVHT